MQRIRACATLHQAADDALRDISKALSNESWDCAFVYRRNAAFNSLIAAPVQENKVNNRRRCFFFFPFSIATIFCDNPNKFVGKNLGISSLIDVYIIRK